MATFALNSTARFTSDRIWLAMTAETAFFKGGTQDETERGFE